MRGIEGALGENLRLGRLLAYALKLTARPRECTVEDIDGLRAAGLSEAGIHDLVSITAYFNFVNRMALGLGVELEPAGS